MRRYNVVVSPFAAANIREAHAWLSARNPAYADRWLADIREKILSLDTLPESHAVARESAAFDVEIRQVLVGRARPGRCSSRSRDRRFTCFTFATAVVMPGPPDITFITLHSISTAITILSCCASLSTCQVAIGRAMQSNFDQIFVPCCARSAPTPRSRRRLANLPRTAVVLQGYQDQYDTRERYSGFR